MGTYLGHVRANVSDLHAAVSWYEQVLGFEVAAYWPPESPDYCHFKSDGGATFGLMVEQGRGARFNFTVDDPDALWDKLKDDPRVRVVEELFTTAYRSRKFTIADPDCNELGFVRDLD